MKLGDRVTWEHSDNGRKAIGEIVGQCWTADGRNADSYGKRCFLVKFPLWHDPIAIEAAELRLLTPLEELAEAAE